MTWTVAVTREGDKWLGECVELPYAHTWAPSLSRLRAYMSEAIILAADLPDDAEPELRLVAGPDVDGELVRGFELARRREQLDEAAAELRADTSAATRSLRAAGYSMRDVAALLGITPGRVAQLVKSGN